MTCKFCSVKEAAERLDATEDQIENLLRKGMLREFRDGPHRLLRTADIGAIVMARNRRLERQGQPRMAPTPRSSALSEGPRARTRRVDPEVRTQYQTLSLRQWFWIGLIQDNPMAIILLCGFVLLMLSALVAGAYALKDVL